MSRALEAARASGLVAAGEPLLVMLSGGADSVCLLDIAVKLGARASALHVNYGLRGEDADADADLCGELCGRLGVPLRLERVALSADGGNLQARARDARYELAERLAERDYAAAHTLSDQAETVLYRLASSPGRRSLMAMAPRRGRLVRPLLAATRAETREHCRAAGLAWREDATNADPRFARSRVRHEVLPVLEELAPGAEADDRRDGGAPARRGGADRGRGGCRAHRRPRRDRGAAARAGARGAAAARRLRRCEPTPSSHWPGTAAPPRPTSAAGCARWSSTVASGSRARARSPPRRRGP